MMAIQVKVRSVCMRNIKEDFPWPSGSSPTHERLPSECLHEPTTLLIGERSYLSVV